MSWVKVGMAAVLTSGAVAMAALGFHDLAMLFGGGAVFSAGYNFNGMIHLPKKGKSNGSD